MHFNVFYTVFQLESNQKKGGETEIKSNTSYDQSLNSTYYYRN